MPRYQYFCEDCGNFDRIMRVADHVRELSCDCGRRAKQVITAPIVVIPAHMSATGGISYESPATGNIITSERDRRNDLAVSGCIEYDPGMRQDVDRRKAEEDKALDAAVDETVEREFATMPSHKLEQLSNELERGADISVERI
jgi:putative FmdB family regulatory protein